MATKKLKKKVQRKPAARKVENPVVESARDIWLAGLGAPVARIEAGVDAIAGNRWPPPPGGCGYSEGWSFLLRGRA